MLGYMAGPNSYDKGSGSNFLCVHEHTSWGAYNVASSATYSGGIWGAIYDIGAGTGYDDKKPFSYDNIGVGAELRLKKAVCAACWRPNSSDNLRHCRQTGLRTGERRHDRRIQGLPGRL